MTVSFLFKDPQHTTGLQKKTPKGTVGRNSKEKNTACSQINSKPITSASLADLMAKSNLKAKVRLKDSKLPWLQGSKSSQGHCHGRKPHKGSP
jgi:hypothetical protein